MPKCVTVQIQAPSDGSVGTVTEGFYIVEGDKLTMTFANGDPVEIDGQRVERTLSEGDNPKRVAGRLVLMVRRGLTGRTVVQDAFDRSLDYPQRGYA